MQDHIALANDTDLSDLSRGNHAVAAHQKRGGYVHIHPTKKPGESYLYIEHASGDIEQMTMLSDAAIGCLNAWIAEGYTAV